MNKSMGRIRGNRTGSAVGRRQTEKEPQVKIANPSDRQIRTEKPLFFQQVSASVKFNGEPILVNRRSFSEIARSQAPTIIYNEKNKDYIRKVLVVFNPTTKTYKILSFQPSNSNIANSPIETIEIEPSTEEGQAWVQCLQQAYPYYDFENAKISPNYQKLAETLRDQWMLEQLQQIEVSVQFGEQKLLVSRRTFSEIARSQAPTIIYTEENKHARKILVVFNPTTKTYKILSFQPSNSNIANSPIETIEIEPSTEEGQAWVQCLQQAYPYYDFENAEILNEYKYYENLLDLFSISLPKIIERQDDRLQAFEQSGSVVENLLYSRISYETLKRSFPRLFWFDPDNHTHYMFLFDPNFRKYILIARYRKERFLYAITIENLLYSRISYEELEKSFPRLFWFDPHSYTHYILLFDQISRKYTLVCRYRQGRFLYIVTVEIQVINKETGYVKFSKKIAKQWAQALKPRGPLKPRTSSSKENNNAQQQPENQLPKTIYDHLVSTITTVLQDQFSSTEILKNFVKATIAEMIQKLPAAKLADLNSLNQDFCEKFIKDNTRAIVTKILPHNNLNPEETRPVLTEGKHPELIALINLLHSVYPDYDFDLGKVKDKSSNLYG